MRVVALISGGKDSTFNMMECIAAGHEIVALANLVPYNNTEMDSYMYQSVGHEAIDLIAQAIDLPLFRKVTHGSSKIRKKSYEPCETDEVEDLYFLLEEIKTKLEFDGVAVGAILSDYQRLRVENVCLRLNLIPLAYLWQRNQEELLNEIIKCEVDAILIKVATLGLDPKKHLGRSLSLLQPHLLSMKEKYGLNVCGEGGEYETLTLDCPLFTSRIVVIESEVVIHQDDPIAPVGYLKLNTLILEFKLPPLDLKSRLERLPLKDCLGHITDDEEDVLASLSNETDTDTNELLLEELDNAELNNIKSALKLNPTYGSNKDGWLWISGIQSWKTDPAEALDEAIEKLKYILQLNGQELTDICSLTMYISDMAQYPQLNESYIKNFNHINPPTRACVQVPLLPIQINAISWKNINTEINGDIVDIERHTMHVQSISHWAPCNIGPYSQAVQIGELIYLAGQIALVPGNMTLINGGIKAQCKLVVRHVSRLLNAIDNNINLRHVVQGICYITHSSFIEPAKKYWEAKTKNAIIEYVIVSGLPRGALIELHVWAHKHNSQFEYEEKGKCIGNYSISLYRRVNYESNIAAIVCRIEQTDESEIFDKHVFSETLSYLLQKLKHTDDPNTFSICNLQIFYNAEKLENPEDLLEIIRNFALNSKLVYDFIPVLQLKSHKTLLTVCAIRNQ